VADARTVRNPTHWGPVIGRTSAFKTRWLALQEACARASSFTELGISKSVEQESAARNSTLSPGDTVSTAATGDTAIQDSKARIIRALDKRHFRSQWVIGLPFPARHGPKLVNCVGRTEDVLQCIRRNCRFVKEIPSGRGTIAGIKFVEVEGDADYGQLGAYFGLGWQVEGLAFMPRDSSLGGMDAECGSEESWSAGIGGS